MKHAIGIIRTSGIGDIILSTVAINVIRKNIPDAEIVWFGREPANSLIRQAYPGVKVVELDNKNTYRKNIEIIRHSADKFCCIIDLQRSARSIILGFIIARMSHCTYTTWNKYSFHRTLLVLQSRLRGRKIKYDLLTSHLPQRYRKMADCTFKALKKIKSVKNNNDKIFPSLRSFTNDQKDLSVCICLGAKFDLKALPLQRIEYIIREVVANSPITKFYLLGDMDQVATAESLISRNTNLNILNFCGRTTLAEAASMLSKSMFSIANDSALMHLSEAVNTPVIAFFGPTHEKFGYNPYLRNSVVIANENLGCRPCNKNGDTSCRYNDRACNRISDELLSHAVNKMIRMD